MEMIYYNIMKIYIIKIPIFEKDCIYCIVCNFYINECLRK